MAKSRDPKHGAQKVTNTDEQEVVVNHSDVQDGGYDEPANQQVDEKPVEQAPVPEKPESEKRNPNPVENKGTVRKKPYHDEESE
jgi:hypothetical protein